MPVYKVYEGLFTLSIMFFLLMMINIIQQGTAGSGSVMFITEDGELFITTEDGETITIES